MTKSLPWLAAACLALAAWTPIAGATVPTEAAIGAFSCAVPQSQQAKFADRLRKFSARNGFEVDISTPASGATTIQIWRMDLMVIGDNAASPDIFQVRIYAGSPKLPPADSMTHRVLRDLRHSLAEVASCHL